MHKSKTIKLFLFYHLKTRLQWTPRICLFVHVWDFLKKRHPPLVAGPTVCMYNFDYADFSLVYIRVPVPLYLPNTSNNRILIMVYWYLIYHFQILLAQLSKFSFFLFCHFLLCLYEFPYVHFSIGLFFITYIIFSNVRYNSWSVICIENVTQFVAGLLTFIMTAFVIKKSFWF